MALLICDDCTTAYTPGAPACPHCGATDSHEEGTEPTPAKKAPAKKPATKEAE